MRIRRILAAVIATAALAGLGLTGAATAATAQGAPSVVSPSECRQGGGMPRIDLPGNPCVGGTHDGDTVD
ncbi:hypothetical protein [Streptomyces sp. NBC_01320]|uniref:hypothetical protein n=1 Tax=Streptomyces sp. NBC_01320 TaxID=2903824 RepID=UPI002E114828|nr:hypothetical protein OG395_35570 [Streptomyces sp. NBC_01320]